MLNGIGTPYEKWQNRDVIYYFIQMLRSSLNKHHRPPFWFFALEAFTLLRVFVWKHATENSNKILIFLYPQ